MLDRMCISYTKGTMIEIEIEIGGVADFYAFFEAERI